MVSEHDSPDVCRLVSEHAPPLVRSYLVPIRLPLLPLPTHGSVQARVLQLVSELTLSQQAQSEAAVREQEGRAADASMHQQEAEAERRAWEKKLEQVCVCVVAGGGGHLAHPPSGPGLYTCRNAR